jgi:hypothetical protein
MTARRSISPGKVQERPVREEDGQGTRSLPPGRAVRTSKTYGGRFWEHRPGAFHGEVTASLPAISRPSPSNPPRHHPAQPGSGHRKCEIQGRRYVCLPLGIRVFGEFPT